MRHILTVLFSLFLFWRMGSEMKTIELAAYCLASYLVFKPYLKKLISKNI
ncbi:MAG: hypothetical protein GX074_03970 [Erysipelothrix sp.]|nr:hypothetical protein [Erysipelothrix sp.]